VALATKARPRIPMHQEPPRRGVDAHVAYVGSGEHRPVGGQSHGLDRVEVLPPPDHMCLVEEGWWGETE
jgi:hypothetical protein